MKFSFGAENIFHVELNGETIVEDNVEVEGSEHDVEVEGYEEGSQFIFNLDTVLWWVWWFYLFIFISFNVVLQLMKNNIRYKILTRFNEVVERK